MQLTDRMFDKLLDSARTTPNTRLTFKDGAFEYVHMASQDAVSRALKHIEPQIETPKQHCDLQKAPEAESAPKQISTTRRRRNGKGRGPNAYLNWDLDHAVVHGISYMIDPNAVDHAIKIYTEALADDDAFNLPYFTSQEIGRRFRHMMANFKCFIKGFDDPAMKKGKNKYIFKAEEECKQQPHMYIRNAEERFKAVTGVNITFVDLRRKFNAI